VERFGRSGVPFGELTRGCCSSRAAQAWPVGPVCVTSLTGECHLWDLPRVNCLTRVSLGRGVAGQFLVVWSCFARLCVGFSFRAGCVLGVFFFQSLEKSLRLSGTLVMRLL
jgi:hypothetical protein